MSGLKKPLRGTRFNSWKEVREKSKTALMAIPTIEFQKCFESWIKRWYKCVATMGSALKRTILLLMNKICILKFSEWISGNFLMKVVLSNNTLTINKNSLIIVVYHKITTILQKYRKNIPAMNFLRRIIVVAIFIRYYWYIMQYYCKITTINRNIIAILQNISTIFGNIAWYCCNIIITKILQKYFCDEFAAYI